MVGENLQGHLVLLLRPPDLVVQLGVVQGQSTVHGKRFEGLLVLLTVKFYIEKENGGRWRNSPE